MNPLRIKVTMQMLEQALDQNKRLLVKAHRAEAWEAAKELSSLRDGIKRHIHRFKSIHCECGKVKSPKAARCQLCALRHRFYKNQIHDRKY